jgi:peptide/nickel transport system permease protein
MDSRKPIGLGASANPEAHPPGREASFPVSRSIASAAATWWVSHYYLRFVLRRALAALFLLWGMTLVAFTLTNVVPSDPVAAALGERLSQDPLAVQAFKQRYGLDQPLPQQYLTYLVRLVHGDLGTSYVTGQNVFDDLSRYVPATFELGIAALAIGLTIGTLIGLATGTRKGGWLDQVARLFSIATISAPLFWIAFLAVYLLSFKLSIFPSGGQLNAGSLPPPHVTGAYIVDALLAGDTGLAWEALQHVGLPATVLSLPIIGLLSRFVRSAVIQVSSSDFVAAARAKGLPARTVLIRYTLRAALSPIVTLFGLLFADVMTGAVLVEVSFSWPGVGLYAYRGAIALDIHVIIGVALFVAVVYLATNLAVDLLYAWIDPRVRVSGMAGSKGRPVPGRVSQ